MLDVGFVDLEDGRIINIYVGQEGRFGLADIGEELIFPALRDIASSS